ncbi:hypothetical protein [Emcibacter sp. SYSU 3D8]|uniref:hypothetical protein n=1 Tax=Emcibacter sp. SYSU 3D8 TaxID=3133969 RepID=UPI0031FF0DF0
MGSETVDLLSPYRPEECARRLRTVTDPGRRFRGNNPLVGMIADGALRVRRRLAYRNWFQTYMFGVMERTGDGTLLHCRFGLHPAALIFLIVWFSFVIIGVGVGLAVALDLFGVNQGIKGPLWPAAIVPIIMAVFALVWLKLSRRLAEEDELFMIELMRFSLDAEVTPEAALRRAAVEPR